MGRSDVRWGDDPCLASVPDQGAALGPARLIWAAVPGLGRDAFVRADESAFFRKPDLDTHLGHEDGWGETALAIWAHAPGPVIAGLHEVDSRILCHRASRTAVVHPHGSLAHGEPFGARCPS